MCLKASDSRRLEGGGKEYPTKLCDIKKDEPKATLAFCRQMALHFLQTTGHIWLVVHATTVTSPGTATHSYSDATRAGGE